MLFAKASELRDSEALFCISNCRIELFGFRRDRAYPVGGAAGQIPITPFAIHKNWLFQDLGVY